MIVGGLISGQLLSLCLRIHDAWMERFNDIASTIDHQTLDGIAVSGTIIRNYRAIYCVYILAFVPADRPKIRVVRIASGNNGVWKQLVTSSINS